jgi:spore germination cell wall hydrolase CwlJ-like protein
VSVDKVVLGARPKGALVAPFGLSVLVFALLPMPVGPQDLTALFPHPAAADQRPAPASAFGTLRVAAFRFPQPVGTVIPRPAAHRLASLDPDALDLTIALPRAGEADEASDGTPIPFPRLDRRLKGDSLFPPEPAIAPVLPPSPSALAHAAHAALAPAPDSELAPGSHLLPGDTSLDAQLDDNVWPDLGSAELSPSLNPTMDTARLYFGVGALDAPPDVLDRPEAVPEHEIPMPAHRPADADGERVAGKGEVTGNGKGPSSPAERLGLSAKTRAKAEKCLAEAVYFESRGESVRGQMAVAQVVMNRVFSEFYPDNVCDVVYQNAHRRLACQFTFACDGIRDVVRDQDAWQRAKRIAVDTLDGKLWLEDVGKATHYHAYWVRPWWIRTMRKLHKIGVHSFYRPRRWGDGSDEPMWGNAAATAEAAKTL